jgi:hypothetical protein
VSSLSAARVKLPWLTTVAKTLNALSRSMLRPHRSQKVNDATSFCAFFQFLDGSTYHQAGRD